MRAPLLASGMLAGILFLASSARPASAGLEDRVKRLYSELLHCPLQATSPRRVFHLTVRLVQFDPLRVRKYYNVALSRLPADFAAANANRLALLVTKTLKKSGLSASQLARILHQINNHGDPYVPPPTLSPTP